MRLGTSRVLAFKMAEQIYSESIRKVIANKKQLEGALAVKVINKGKLVFIEGSPEDEIIALEVIEAMDLGFSASQALDIKNEDFAFEKIFIKRITKRNDMSQIRARVIGTERKALKNIELLTGCDIVLHHNVIGIVGLADEVRKAAYAVRKLISGSKHANVYSYLEEEKEKEKAGVW